MWKFSGNITGEILSQQQNLPMVIKNFLLKNKTGGTIGASVYLFNGATNISISPTSNQLTADQLYTLEQDILLEANEQVRLATTGSVDYIFNIENTKPDGTVTDFPT